MSQEEVLAETDQTNDSGKPPMRLRPVLIIVIALASVMAIVTGAWLLLRSAGKHDSAAAPDKTIQIPIVIVSHVVSKDVERQLKLPGELRAYQDVAIYPKVQ